MAGTDQEFELEEIKKRTKPPEPKAKDLGPLLMAALAILLLAFFILLVSMATIDSEKRKVALRSVAGTFGVFEGGASIMPGKGISEGGAGQEELQFVSSMSMLQQYVKARGFEKEAFIDGTSKGFTISITANALFRPGEARLLSKTYRMLDMIKFVIADSQEKFRVRIEGHTDDTPTNNEKFPSNWELSVARAIATLRYILRDTGVKGAQLGAAGYAGFRPKVPNDSPEGRARNRRVEFAFLIKEKIKGLDPAKSIEVGGFKFNF
ncbi:flagellar motor protein MotB [Nitrospinota bacterium]